MTQLTKEEIEMIERQAETVFQLEEQDAWYSRSGYVVAATKYLLQLKAERERAGKLVEALEAILKEPYGCRFCDSGKLRKPNNPDKDHDHDCGYLLAEAVLSNIKNEKK